MKVADVSKIDNESIKEAPSQEQKSKCFLPKGIKELILSIVVTVAGAFAVKGLEIGATTAKAKLNTGGLFSHRRPTGVCLAFSLCFTYLLLACVKDNVLNLDTPDVIICCELQVLQFASWYEQINNLD